MSLELNRTYCMDCLEGLKSINDNSIDLIVTDPPYNIGKDFQNDNLQEEDYIAFFLPILNEMARVIKPKRSVIIFFDFGKKLPLFFKSLLFSKLKFQKGGVLYKPNDCSMPHNRTLRKSEAFLICSKTDELSHDGDSYIHDVLIANHGKKEKWYHPTAKAKKPIRDLIESHSKKGELVLDCFMGSGTTALACKELGRDYLGFEIEPDYIKIANERLSQETLTSLFAKDKLNETERKDG